MVWYATMKLNKKLLQELQSRLNVGNKRGIHLNAIPGRSRSKLDLYHLDGITKGLSKDFIYELLHHREFSFPITVQSGLKQATTGQQARFKQVKRSFQNLINDTEATESEKGINTFGFGYPLLIRRDRADKKLTVAPLLIWSLRIRRLNTVDTWEISRSDDDPIYLNEVLLNHLRSDAHIGLNDLRDQIAEKSLIKKNDLMDICEQVFKQVGGEVPDSFDKGFKKKLLNPRSIGSIERFEKQIPRSSRTVLIQHSGVFSSAFEVQKENIVNDYDMLLQSRRGALDIKNFSQRPFQAISSVQTDPSQQEILHALSYTRNVVIQGPPGTGKSQSLTAILVNALENRRKTVVVCEKRTALEVLENALDRLGLGHHTMLIKDSKKDRGHVMEGLRAKIEGIGEITKASGAQGSLGQLASGQGSAQASGRNSHKSNGHVEEKLNATHAKIYELINTIHTKHNKLQTPLLGEKNWTQLVGDFLRVYRKRHGLPLPQLHTKDFRYTEAELHELVACLKEGEALYRAHAKSQNLRFLHPLAVRNETPHDLEHKIHKSFAQYRLEVERIQSEIREYEKEYYQKRIALLDTLEASVKQWVSELSAIFQAHRDNPKFLENPSVEPASYGVGTIFSKNKRESVRDYKRIRAIFESLETQSKESLAFAPITLTGVSVQDGKDLCEDYLKQIRGIRKSFWARIKQTFSELTLFELMGTTYETPRLVALVESIRNLADTIESDRFSSFRLILNNDKTILKSIQELLSIKDKYFASSGDLYPSDFGWFQFYYSCNEQSRKLLDTFSGKADWAQSFSGFYLNVILKAHQDNNLPVDNRDYDALSRALEEVEQQQVRYINQRWIETQRLEVERFNTSYPIGVHNLYNTKGGGKQKRYSLRKVVQFDIDFFTSFYPVILTTPDVCSTLFPHDPKRGKYFDIVMFDEASQLRVEDNLPALLKGHQIIIAGDEHQMPPSSYFQKQVYSTDMLEVIDDEEAEIIAQQDEIILACESLLDFGLESDFHKKYLDFHYRSHHPYLIDFSNQAFYEQRLKPLPREGQEVPIEYIQVGGTYFDRENHQEAEAVIEILKKRIHPKKDGTYPSVGIATFNITQRDLITNKIIEYRNNPRHKAFHEKMIKLEQSGLFIKNLENIQGDERDIIILSTTFGVTPDGDFYHRFGPVNQQQGYKLLNVIITRAKYKVYACTSIPESIFLKYKHYLEESKTNNRKAVFFAYLAYCKAVSDRDEESREMVLDALAENVEHFSRASMGAMGRANSFISEVAAALAERISRGTVISNTRLGGFSVDIVYIPALKRAKKVVIECDGFSGYQSRETYLHDIHRQRVLEDHNMVFYRVWSTNWWRNPKRELNRLVAVIQEQDARAVKGHG